MTAPSPPQNARLPPLFPEAWASGWGQDRFGLWQSFTVGDATQMLRWIPLGDFLMGSPKDARERESFGNDETQHTVILTRGFWLADTACTQALWRAVLDESPSRFKGDDLPVDEVSWTDIVERFLPALNEAVPGLEAALPTEAQWEYACRAGTTTPFSFGANISPEQVNYNSNYPYADGKKGLYREKTVPVKALPANAWGLYQMHGNVWEWCADWLDEYPEGTLVDPVGPADGRERVLRGGGWRSYGGGWNCRSAFRYGFEPGNRSGYYGFRLARGLPPAGLAGSAGASGVAGGGGAPAAAADAPARE